MLGLCFDHGLIGMPALELFARERGFAGRVQPMLDRAEPSAFFAGQLDLLIHDQTRYALLPVLTDDTEFLAGKPAATALLW